MGDADRLSDKDFESYAVGLEAEGGFGEFVTEAKRARASEAAFLKSGRGAWHALQSLLAMREGITDELLQDVAAGLASAITATGEKLP